MPTTWFPQVYTYTELKRMRTLHLHMDNDLHNTQVKIEDEGHMTHIAHLTAIFVLFASFRSVIPEISVIKTSNFRHKCIYVLCTCLQ